MGRRAQGVTLYSGVMWIIGMGIVVQLWLGTSALEALLARHTAVLVPAAVASVVLALLNGGLVWIVYRMDANIRREMGPPE